jgi:gliding motility-associated-like protein
MKKSRNPINYLLLITGFLMLGNGYQSQAQETGMIVNEFSNGSSGTKEYMEFLVVGCPGTTVDLRGWKIDDNNGDFSDGPKSGAGIAPGHTRLSMHAQWASIKVGSLIVLYNSMDVNPSVPTSDPTDANNDWVYILSHDDYTYVEVCESTPSSSASNASYTCTDYTSGTWNTIGLANNGDAAQVRKPDGSYFHGIGYGNISGGPDNLYFSGAGGSKVYSFSSCNYRNIANFSVQSTSSETPGAANNTQNQQYITHLRTGLTAGTIGTNQSICVGQSIAALKETTNSFRCSETFQWQSSTTSTPGGFSNIAGATAATYTNDTLSVTRHFRRVVKNSCESDTSNIVTITVAPSLSKPDKPTVPKDTLCINPTNSSASTNPVAGASTYIWELHPANAGTITGHTNTVSIDWNDLYSGQAKLVVIAKGCGQSPTSDTTYISIINPTAHAGSDQLHLCSDTTSLSAAVGTGLWSIESGNGGTLETPTAYNSRFWGIANEVYTLRWTLVSSTCGTGTYDELKVSFTPISAPLAFDTSRCGKGSVTIRATGVQEGNYRWYTAGQTLISGQNQSTLTTGVLENATLFYVSSFLNNCESQKIPVNVTIHSLPIVSAGTSQTIMPGEKAYLQGQSNATFVWSPAESLDNPYSLSPEATPTKTTVYTLSATNTFGCKASDTITVYIICDGISIPNLITPNGDGYNDRFYIGCTQGMDWQLEIYNRWGETVYFTSNYQNEWEATELADGVYYYHLASKRSQLIYKGWLQVTR